MRTEKTDVNKMSVALLIEDIREAKELSLVFRQAGIIPHIYEDLKSFWFGSLKETPTLSIVDVKLSTQDELVLKNHPKILDGSLTLSFFYTAQSEALLFSTFEINHVGLLRQGISYDGQVKAMLRRLNELNLLKEKAQNWEVQSAQLDGKIERLISKTEELKEKEYYYRLVKSLVSRFEMQRSSDNFFTAFSNVITSVKEISAFSFLELSHNKQKLISPKLTHSKFKDVPSLWLGKTCQNGIEFFAQNMASQVCLDLIGGELMSLLIQGKNDHPDMILFVQVADEDFVNNFDWENLERYLSGLYSHFELRDNQIINQTSNQLSPWELFSRMDTEKFGQLPGDESTSARYSLVDIDFSDLVDLVRAKPGVRFYWNQFFGDFFRRFEQKKNYDCQITPMGIYNVGLLVEAEKADEVFAAMKSFIMRYPFWKFFEDVDIVLARNMKPEVRLLSFSTEEYLTYLEGKSMLVAPTAGIEKKVGKRKLIISQGPEVSM